MKHDLVVGGSGMLAGLCKALAARGRTVSVVGRTRWKLDKLASAGGGLIHPLIVDYRFADRVPAEVEAAVARHGPIERVVCWTHEEVSTSAPLQFGGYASTGFLHVMGSAAADPAAPSKLQGWRDQFSLAYPALPYRAVVLGFVQDAAIGHARWLTHEEISAGVKRALDSNELLSIVGKVEPWSSRP